MSLQIAVATEDFGAPLKAAIAEAARCPVQGLRLNARTEVRADEFSDTAIRQLRHFVTERQLLVAGLTYPSRHSLHDPDSLDRRIDGIRAAMTLVRKLGTSELLVRCGRIPDPDDVSGTAATAPSASVPTNTNVDSLLNPFSFAPSAAALKPSGPTGAQQFAVLCDILNDLIRYGSHVGCTLQLQLADFQPNRIQRLLGQLTGGPVGLVFDPATAVMTGRSPVAVFRDLYQHVGYIRARDAMADVDGAGLEVPLGDGTVDWIELLATFAEAHYLGWICVERMGGEQRAEDVRLGVSRICNLLLQGPH